MLPLREGWDEYAHLACLQYLVNNGTLPHFDTPVSREIGESMRLAPLAYELRELGPPYLTNEQWWALPADGREDRRLRPMPLKFSNCPVVARTRRTAKLVGQVSDLSGCSHEPAAEQMLGASRLQTPGSSVRNWGPTENLSGIGRLRLSKTRARSAAYPLRWRNRLFDMLSTNPSPPPNAFVIRRSAIVRRAAGRGFRDGRKSERSSGQTRRSGAQTARLGGRDARWPTSRRTR